jgi:hypothetical protein
VFKFSLTVSTLLLAPLVRADEPFHFENQIAPLLSRHGCNSSGCHGKAEGQGGFKLSVFGFDPQADFASIVKEGRGRRLLPEAPDASLLLRKATGRVPHGGGTRLKVGSKDYATLRGWIAAGTPVGDPNAPRVESLRVEPVERVLTPRASQQLRVVARYTDGREADVTDHARFQTNHDGLASVSVAGLVTAADTPGEVAVMAAYLGQVAVFRAIIPRPGPPVAGEKLPQFNFIDELVDRKLAKLNVAPSLLCDDATFLRRATLDLTGTLPTPDEARAFLANRAADKRAKLVEALLTRPAFADYMALKWSDVLRVDRQALGHRRAYTYYKWIRDSFVANKPFDRFATELLTAEGPLSEVGPANFYLAVPKPGEAASTLAQVFLGVRIACAECHHHPADRWSQADYTGMVAFFVPVTVRESVVSRGDAVAKHPRTGETVFAHAIGTKPPAANPPGDRRPDLARWMTDPANPYFARNLANRVWGQLLGRGLVEAVDDVRATNPPSNPELLDALAKFTDESKYDVRQLIRLICASRVYQASTAPNATNEKDEQNFSRAYFKRPDAEVLLDMIGDATGVPDRFPGSAPGTRAIQLWDNKARHDFLKLFGRPVRASACECERNHEPSPSQVLNLLNSAEIQRKLSHETGTAAKLALGTLTDAALVEELYLRFYSRLPTANERDTATEYLRKARDRRKAVEDLTWALLNSLEFLFNH